jgi:hypothetical protein
MVSAYERGRRTPGIATFERLLAAAGGELAVELVPVGSGLEDRISSALAEPVESRLERFAEPLRQMIAAFGELRFAVDGLAAAALHGVPVKVERISVLLADEGDAPEAAATALLRCGAMLWAEQIERFTHMPAAPALTMRAANPSLWWFPLWDETAEITVCPPERLDGVQLVSFQDADVPVAGLWALQVQDPAVAVLIERTRARMISQRG